MFSQLWAFRWLHHRPASRVVKDETGVLWGLAALHGKLPVFSQGLPLHTWRSNQNMEANGASRSSFKAEWFPSVFDIETAKAFRHLINYCFHRGNHNKWFVSCCLTEITTGTVNGKSNLHLLPAGMNCGKYLIKRYSKATERRDNVAQNSWKPKQFLFWFIWGKLLAVNR